MPALDVDTLINAAKIIGGVISGGGLVLFLNHVFSSGDNRLADRRKDKNSALAWQRKQEERGRMYEIAYRHANGWALNLVTMVAPAVLSLRRGEKDVALDLLDVACDSLLEADGTGFKIKPVPNFIRSARLELNDINNNQDPKDETENTDG